MIYLLDTITDWLAWQSGPFILGGMVLVALTSFAPRRHDPRASKRSDQNKL